MAAQLMRWRNVSLRALRDSPRALPYEADNLLWRIGRAKVETLNQITTEIG